MATAEFMASQDIWTTILISKQSASNRCAKDKTFPWFLPWSHGRTKQEKDELLKATFLESSKRLAESRSESVAILHSKGGSNDNGPQNLDFVTTKLQLGHFWNCSKIR